MELSHMSPRRPYILRAFYDWLLDNQLTPYLVVNAEYVGTIIPMEFVQDGQIVLNIAPQAVGNFLMSRNEVQFSARFSGIPRQVYVPMGAIMAIYARENGAGTMFESEPGYEQDERPIGKEKTKPTIQLVDESEKQNNNNNFSENDEPPQPPKGRPALRVVK